MFCGDLNLIQSDKKKAKKSLYLGFFIVLSIYCYINIDVFFSLTQLWSYSGSYNYSYIISFISLLWIIHNFNNKEYNISQSAWPIVGLIFCLGFCFIAYAVQLALFFQLSMLVAFWFIIYALFGKDLAGGIIRPLTLLVSTLPALNLISDFQIDKITTITTWFLIKFNLLVNINGKILETANIYILINKTFTGLRYFNVTLVLSLIFSFVYIKKNVVRLLYVLSCLIFSACVNLLRVLVIVYLANSKGIEDANYYNIYLGWICFGFILTSIIYLGLLFRHKSSKKISNANKYFNYLQLGNKTPYHLDISYLILNLLIISSLLLGFNTLKKEFRYIAHGNQAVNFLGIRLNSYDWQVCEICNISDWYPVVGKPDAKLIMTFNKRDENRFLDLYIGYYGHQYEGNTLATIRNTMKYSKLWRANHFGTRRIVLTFDSNNTMDNNRNQRQTSNFMVNTTILTNTESELKRVIWYWYWNNGINTSNKYYAKLLEAYDVIQTFRTNSALIALSMQYSNDNELVKAEKYLNDFLDENIDSLYPKVSRLALAL